MLPGIEAQALGADNAYPNQGMGLFASIASVAQQMLSGPNASTHAAITRIVSAIAGSTSPVDIIAYSGGAGAFAAAYNLLTSSQKSMIGNILYISPSAAGSPLPHNGQTSYVFGRAASILCRRLEILLSVVLSRRLIALTQTLAASLARRQVPFPQFRQTGRAIHPTFLRGPIQEGLRAWAFLPQ